MPPAPIQPPSGYGIVAHQTETRAAEPPVPPRVTCRRLLHALGGCWWMRSGSALVVPVITVGLGTGPLIATSLVLMGKKKHQQAKETGVRPG